MNSEQIKSTVTEILSLYEKFGGDDYIGEPVSQIEHMCQCAHFAEKAGYDNEVILAAFFHDIGHLCEHSMPVTFMDSYGVMDHEKIGALYLRSNGFSDRICRLVASHVSAKRYLTYRVPEYYQQLSEASKETLKFQGGRMTEPEALAFEADPLSDIYIALRKWDELAKEEKVPLPSMDYYRQLMEQHLLSQKNS